MGKVFIRGIENDVDEVAQIAIIKEAFYEATNHLSWLRKGDLVLLKPALNSPNGYPSTTDPLAIKAVREVIEKKGGRVVIGDQSGIGHVLQGERGVVRGSTRDCYKKSGMAKSGGNFVAFEEEDWNDRFYKFQNEETHSWPNGFWMTKWVKEADHIVNVPRISSHVQAGVTLGFKNLVGLLREDSRVEFHSTGPFYFSIRGSSKGSGIPTNFEARGRFIEKIVEINSAVREKIRSTVFMGTKVLATIGPDFGYIVQPDPGLLIISSDQVAAEAAAIAFLTYIYRTIPLGEKIKQKAVVMGNGQIYELGRKKVWEHPFIKHAMELGWGEVGPLIEYVDVPEEMSMGLDELLVND